MRFNTCSLNLRSRRLARGSERDRRSRASSLHRGAEDSARTGHRPWTPAHAGYRSGHANESGQIAWVLTPFTDGIPQIMKVERDSPEDHFASKSQLRNMKESDFRKKQKLPIKLLNPGETEELVVVRSKLRPCIVLQIGQTSFPDRECWDRLVISKSSLLPPELESDPLLPTVAGRSLSRRPDQFLGETEHCAHAYFAYPRCWFSS